MKTTEANWFLRILEPSGDKSNNAPHRVMKHQCSIHMDWHLFQEPEAYFRRDSILGDCKRQYIPGFRRLATVNKTLRQRLEFTLNTLWRQN